MMKFSKFKVKTEAYVSVMWSTFHRYITNGPVEMDTTIVKSTNDTLKMLKRPQPYDNDEFSS